MEAREVFIFVCGIMNFPGESDNWTGRAVTWTHASDKVANPCAKAEKIEYFCGPVDRVLGQTERAAKLVKTLSFYRGWNITLVGHSNGAAVILDALAAAGWPIIKALHLISAACESDFTKNGLNAALLDSQVGTVTVYVGGKDMALRLAHSWAGRLLGYGTLGLAGPEYVDGGLKGRVDTRLEPAYGHSDWFTELNFPPLMRLIVPPPA